MSLKMTLLSVVCGVLLAAPRVTSAQNDDNYQGTREQRQQQPANRSENDSNQYNSRQSGTESDRNQNQRSQTSDRSDSQSDRSSNRRQSSDRRQGYENSQDYGNQSSNRQSDYDQSRQANYRGEQDNSRGRYPINQQRWRNDREYRDAYFAGLRAGERGADESNYFMFSTSENEQATNDDWGLERRVKLSGRVQKTARANVKGTNQQHQQAQIRTSQGDRYWVDLGPAEDARRLDLGEGDQLTVKGIAVKVGDHSIIFATSANANDERLSFDYYSPSELSDQQSGDNRERSDRQSDRSSERSDRSQSASRSRNSSRDSDEANESSQSDSGRQAQRSNGSQR